MIHSYPQLLRVALGWTKNLAREGAEEVFQEDKLLGEDDVLSKTWKDQWSPWWDERMGKEYNSSSFLSLPFLAIRNLGERKTKEKSSHSRSSQRVGSPREPHVKFTSPPSEKESWDQTPSLPPLFTFCEGLWKQGKQCGQKENQADCVMKGEAPRVSFEFRELSSAAQRMARPRKAETNPPWIQGLKKTVLKTHSIVNTRGKVLRSICSCPISKSKISGHHYPWQTWSQWNGQPRISENVGGCKNAKGTVLETGKNCDRVLQSQSTHWLTCCLW